MFSEINKLLKGDELTNVIYDRSIYDTRRKYLSKTKTDIYKYPIVYFITKTDGAKLLYSCEDRGHFGISKVIWSNGGGTYPIIDEKGEYGLTQFSYAIADDLDNLNHIKKALDNPYFY